MKKNKKNYNYTAYQKQKDKSVGKQQNATSGFRRMFNKERKAKNRQALQKLRQGKEVEFESEKNNVNWYFW